MKIYTGVCVGVKYGRGRLQFNFQSWRQDTRIVTKLKLKVDNITRHNYKLASRMVIYFTAFLRECLILHIVIL